jgi:dipeptidyl aminopeptidase/acylaminoacyl peptidase
MTPRFRHLALALPLVAALAAPAYLHSQSQAPQQGRAFTKADYDNAAKFLGAGFNNLVVGGSANVTWLPDERFWYRTTLADGSTPTILVDPVAKTRVVCTPSIAACQSLGAGATDPAAAQAGRGGRGGRAGGVGGGGRSSGGAPVNTAPDGTKGVFIKDWNLWVRDVATGAERQLTKDGIENFGYATDNAGWTRSANAVALWSPDSKKIATQQQDERKVGDMYMVNTTVGHPTLTAWKYPLPGDMDVQMVHRVIIDVETGKVTRLLMAPDFHRATMGDNLSVNDYEWSPDGSKLALASTSRFHKDATLRVADAASGEVRTLFTESEKTQFESRVNWRVLWDTNEIIWYSQRDNWGHLYLLDLATGQVKNQITKGDGPITAITRLDEKTRTMWVTANGREAAQDPYFAHLYKIKLDGTGYVSLTPDDGTHTAQISPTGRWIVDTYSRCDLAPVVSLRDGQTGRQVLELEHADTSKLLATGWKPPMPFHTKAADGTTDIYGMLFRPTNFDSNRKYPIINQIYPGPQSGSVGSRAWSIARGDRQALAELGFVVVSIDGRGTPGRSKSFHDAYYGAMGRDNTIPDQIAAMKELAKRYPWIDIDRTGIWGHSGGGFATSSAMFRYPDFWKVGISESGNHDQRNYEDDWGERYQGALTGTVGGADDSYGPEGNQNFAKDLKGKLLIAHGGMDGNVPTSNTMLVVEALIRANKDFEMIIFPNAGHGYGAAGNYMMRRRWDFFVRHLLGGTPPANYEIPATPAGGRGGGGPR